MLILSDSIIEISAYLINSIVNIIGNLHDDRLSHSKERKSSWNGCKRSLNQSEQVISIENMMFA